MKKLNELNFLKLKTSAIKRHCYKKIYMSHRLGEKFEKFIFINGLVFTIQKELSKHNNIKNKSIVKN